MRILLVAATEFEVESLKAKVENLQNDPDLKPSTSTFKLLITGVGMVATAFALGRELAANQYDLAVNLGIAGSFDRSLALGNIVEVTEDTLAELGAEDNKRFLTIDQLGFGESTFSATKSLNGISPHPMKTAKGITVNKVHGNEASIAALRQRLDVQTESMEGAAFFYACREAGVRCMQIRAVSNYVEKRNRDAWEIGLAIKNLNNFAVELLKGLDV